jgi:Tfp pilus assembly protein PilX
MAPVQHAKACRGPSGYWRTLDQDPRSLFAAWRTERYSEITHRVREKLVPMLSSWSTQLNEDGMVTAVALLLLAVLTLLGTAAVVVTSTDLLIGGNYKASEQAFYAAEAGVEEARARLRETAAAKISDKDKEEDPAWKVYIGTLEMAQAKGFNSSSLSQSRVDRLQKDGLQADINYVVEVKHKVEAGAVKKTAAGNSIFLVTSTGYTANSNRAVQVEITKVPPISVPAALYVNGEATITGNATVDGRDQCLKNDKPGVATTSSSSDPNPSCKDPNPVCITGSGSVTGVGEKTGQEAVDYGTTPLDFNKMVNSMKSFADFTYTSPPPKDQPWGVPTESVPPTCTENHVVYFKGSNLDLGGGSTGSKDGCGLLLVEGNLTVTGNFSWYGLIIVTGTTVLKGTGNQKVSGGMLVGGTVDALLDASLSGSAEILNCSSAVANATATLPLRTLSWKDLRSTN